MQVGSLLADYLLVSLAPFSCMGIGFPRPTELWTRVGI
jgi:hypothetical protein